MVLFKIKDVDVDFPYEPYSCQLIYMEKVLESLENKVNAVLESPTGTGKTLCLLCACLAWLEKERKSKIGQIEFHQNQLQNGKFKADNALSENLLNMLALPKIIYTSRTHSQLTQVIRELNKTIYKNKIKVALFGSRDQLCINEEVRKEESSSFKNTLCRAKVKSKQCPFYFGINSAPEMEKMGLNKSDQVMDIEDYVSFGRKHKVCPFYKARDNAEFADLLLLPYNYVLEPQNRKLNKIHIANNILIFDEAHNLEKICEDSSSVSFSSADLAGCLRETKETLKMLLADVEEKRKEMDETDAAFGKADVKNNESPDNNLDPKEIGHLLLLLDNLEKEMDSIDLMKLQSDGQVDLNLKGKVLPASFVYELLKKCGIEARLRDSILMNINEMQNFLAEKSTNRVWQSKGVYLTKFSSFINTVFLKEDPRDKDQAKKSKLFKVFIQKDESKKETGQQTITRTLGNGGIVLNYWCFSAALTMESLVSEGVRCIIVTSGTLSPIRRFADELNVPFPVVLENSHVIDKSQVSFSVIRKGPEGEPLLANYNNRTNERYLVSLANTLINLFRVVPQGVLVFFASYSQLQSCLDFWKAGELWDKMNKLKTIFVEPKRKDLFQQCMINYASTVEKELRGAALFGVCRGKISEGVDFADASGRAVVLVGIPYPPMMDARVLLKKMFLNEQKIKSFNGGVWYETEAVRAVNQALGRVIRHKNDFGAIIVADERFSHWMLHFSKWIQPFFENNLEFGHAIRNISTFFKSHRITTDATLGGSKDGNSMSAVVRYSQEEMNQKRIIYERMNSVKLNPTDIIDSNDFTVIKQSYVEKSKYFSNERENTCCSSTSVLDRLESCQVEKEHTKEVNYERTSKYVLHVKQGLSVDDYNKFKDMCKAYKSDNNYDDLVKELKRIFLPNRPELFKGFHIFLTLGHRQRFLNDIGS